MGASLKSHEDFLEKVRIPLRLACKTSSGWPVVISLWFLYQDNKLYCATQKSARVISYIQHDPRVGFEIAEDRPPYCGIRGQAEVQLDETIGFPILERLLVRYLGGTDNQLAENLLAKADNEVAIVLSPVQVFSWNFSRRMQDIPQPEIIQPKVCP
jgi:hypothetical protein